MMMQVLVLAAQNSVDYKYLGVATSGSTLFRQIGGSIGVATFGAIFTNQLADQYRKLLPPGAHVPASANPAILHHLPAALHSVVINAFSSALQPVFVVATFVTVVAFALTFLLQEIPLRGPADTAAGAAAEAGAAVEPAAAHGD